jgi:hypothetical protein
VFSYQSSIETSPADINVEIEMARTTSTKLPFRKLNLKLCGGVPTGTQGDTHFLARPIAARGSGDTPHETHPIMKQKLCKKGYFSSAPCGQRPSQWHKIEFSF